MGSTDFYRGDKKKKKQGEQKVKSSYAPVFVPPKVLPTKGKKDF